MLLPSCLIPLENRVSYSLHGAPGSALRFFPARVEDIPNALRIRLEFFAPCLNSLYPCDKVFRHQLLAINAAYDGAPTIAVVPDRFRLDGATLFHEDWWLNAATGRRWDIVTVERDGVVVASMPFVLRNRFALRFLTMPPYTRTLGPLLANLSLVHGEVRVVNKKRRPSAHHVCCRRRRKFNIPDHAYISST